MPRRRDPKPGDGPTLETQPVADIIEAEGVRQLHEHHRRQMAPDGVGAGLGIHPMLPGGSLDDPLRNLLEKLPWHIDMMAWWLGGWRRSCFGWHRNPNSTQVPRSATQFHPLRPSLYNYPVGCLWK